MTPPMPIVCPLAFPAELPDDAVEGAFVLLDGAVVEVVEPALATPGPDTPRTPRTKEQLYRAQNSPRPVEIGDGTRFVLLRRRTCRSSDR